MHYTVCSLQSNAVYCLTLAHTGAFSPLVYRLSEQKCFH